MRSYRFLPFLAVLIILFAFGFWDKVVAEKNKPSKSLNVYNWEDYFGTTTLEDFEKKFGVKVHLETFEDEEEMISELQSHPEKHDVVITSDDTVRELIEMRLLAEIDLDNTANIKNIDNKFKNPLYDPGNRHSVPYLWGTTGIAVNRTFIKEQVDSWSVLWNPKYKGKIAMLNNPDEVVGAVLKYLGYPLNTTDPSKLEAGRQKLLEQKPLLAGYLDPIEIRDKLVSNKLWAAQIYSGEGMFSVDKNEAVEYFFPKEGAAIWVDCLCIPRDAKHKYTAELFINYILDPEVSAKIVNHLWYANCNIAARPFTEKEILESPSLYPSEEVLKKCEFFKPVGTEKEVRRAEEITNKIWSELQLKKE